MARLTRFSLLSGVLLALAAGGAPAPGHAAPVSDAKVKAAFVYQFIKFVEWPPPAFASAAAPIQLCLLGGPDPFLAALADIEGRSAQGRNIHVRRLPAGSDAQACHLLVVGESEGLQPLAPLLADRSTGRLTVSEIPGFAAAGGMIGLLVESNRVRFEINLPAAQRAELRLSSQLLKLARQVLRP